MIAKKVLEKAMNESLEQGIDHGQTMALLHVILKAMKAFDTPEEALAYLKVIGLEDGRNLSGFKDEIKQNFDSFDT